MPNHTRLAKRLAGYAAQNPYRPGRVEPLPSGRLQLHSALRAHTRYVLSSSYYTDGSRIRCHTRSLTVVEILDLEFKDGRLHTVAVRECGPWGLVRALPMPAFYDNYGHDFYDAP